MRTVRLFTTTSGQQSILLRPTMEWMNERTSDSCYGGCSCCYETHRPQSSATAKLQVKPTRHSPVPAVSLGRCRLKWRRSSTGRQDYGYGMAGVQQTTDYEVVLVRQGQDWSQGTSAFMTRIATCRAKQFIVRHEACASPHPIVNCEIGDMTSCYVT